MDIDQSISMRSSASSKRMQPTVLVEKVNLRPFQEISVFQEGTWSGDGDIHSN